MVCVFPWIIWFLWKNKNGVVFDGVAKEVDRLVQKAREEAEFWFMARAKEEEWIKEEKSLAPVKQKRWSQPPSGWLKCNNRVVWDKHKKMGGAAWILRNEHGSVLMHSRKAFFNSADLDEARHLTVLWAIESMSSHRKNKIIFAVEDSTTVEMITRPRAWPSFKYHIHELMIGLARIEWWRIVVEERPTNRGAFLIAQSVTKELRTQSYVATGPPRWLWTLLDSERVLPSV